MCLSPFLQLVQDSLVMDDSAGPAWQSQCYTPCAGIPGEPKKFALNLGRLDCFSLAQPASLLLSFPTFLQKAAKQVAAPGVAAGDTEAPPEGVALARSTTSRAT